MSEPEVSVNEQDDTVDQLPEQGPPPDEDAIPEEELSDEEALQAKLKEAIQVNIEEVGSLRKKLTICVPRATIDEQLSEQYDELRQEAQVPGFRKGRAPTKLLEKRFGADVGEQVGSSLIGNSYLAAIDKESLETLGDPLMHVAVPEKRTGDDGKETEVEVEKLLSVDEALKYIKLPKEGDLKFSCEVEIKPSFELPSLDKIPVKKVKFEVTDELVNAEITRHMMFRGTFRPVEDGVVQADDVLMGVMTLTVDGNTVETEESAELAARDQRYAGVSVDGFGQAAVGKKIGDEIAVDVTIPDDHTALEMRGKPGKFSFVIKEIKRLEVPKVDAEFLTQTGFDSEEEFRDVVRAGIEQRVDQEIRQAMHAQISQYLLTNTQLEVPSGVSQRQTEHIVSRQMLDLYSKGVHESEISKEIDALRLSAAEQANNDLKHFFIMQKIAEQLDVVVDEEEINTAIAQIAMRRNRRFDRVRDEIVGTDHLHTLYGRLRDQKILEILLADADVTEATPSATKEQGAE